MHRSKPRRTRLATATLAVLLVSSLGACGIDATEGRSNAFAGGSPLGGSTTTSTAPCADDGDSGTNGGNTGGTVGADDQPPACADPTTTTTKDRTTTITEDRTTTTTEDRTTTTTEDPIADEQAYVDVLASSLVGRDDLGEPMTRDQADCIAPRWVDALGHQRLLDASIEPGALADGNVAAALEELIGRPEATDMVAALTECGIDLQAALVTEISKDGNLTDDQVQCIVDALPDGYIENVVAISLADGREALDAEPGLTEPLVDAATACR